MSTISTLSFFVAGVILGMILTFPIVLWAWYLKIRKIKKKGKKWLHELSEKLETKKEALIKQLPIAIPEMSKKDFLSQLIDERNQRLIAEKLAKEAEDENV